MVVLQAEVVGMADRRSRKHHVKVVGLNLVGKEKSWKVSTEAQWGRLEPLMQRNSEGPRNSVDPYNTNTHTPEWSLNIQLRHNTGSCA